MSKGRHYRCTICDAVTDDNLKSHNRVDKGHYYEDPKFRKTGFICDDCHESYGEVINDYQISDALFNDTPDFNASIRKR